MSGGALVVLAHRRPSRQGGAGETREQSDHLGTFPDLHSAKAAYDRAVEWRDAELGRRREAALAAREVEKRRKPGLGGSPEVAKPTELLKRRLDDLAAEGNRVRRAPSGD